MKKEIEQIFLRLYENVQHGVEWEHAQNELQQLMCYREVKAILEYIGLDGLCPEHEDALVMQLKTDYPTKIIWLAIDKVKTESK